MLTSASESPKSTEVALARGGCERVVAATGDTVPEAHRGHQHAAANRDHLTSAILASANRDLEHH
jgi:hypothetical protein